MISKILESAQKNYQQEALVANNAMITYQNLIFLVQKRAEQIRDNTEKNQLVVIQRSNKIDAIIDSLTCLYLECGFLNFPLQYPEDRIKSIISQVKPILFLTDQTHHNFSDALTYDSDLAYMIFTSGTTGVPKGVMIGNKNLNAFLDALQKTLPTDERTRMLQYASFSFDASIWEIFATLCFGGTLVLTPNSVLVGQDLANFMHKHKITQTLLTPVVAQSIIDKHIPSLQNLIVGGDVFPRKILELWNQTYRLWNAYGPTEASICVLMHEFTSNHEAITLGKPLPGNKLFIDKNSGELVIQGSQVGIGYLEKNKTYYFNEQYKTGDLITMSEDGNFFFKGRLDDQIKIRGYRLSLNEIEKTISSHNNIEHACAVVIKKHGTVSLYAFYKGDIKEEVLRENISLLLPHYMVPARFIKISTWPLNSSGKIDKKALRESVKDGKTTHVSEQPKKIAEDFERIWKKVLGSRVIGLDSNFFQFGGQSFQALQVIQNYGEKFNFEMDLITFFDHPTLREHIKYFQRKGKEDDG